MEYRKKHQYTDTRTLTHTHSQQAKNTRSRFSASNWNVHWGHALTVGKTQTQLVFSLSHFLLLFLLLYILLAVFFNWLAESFKQRWCLLNVGCCSLLLLLLLPLLLQVFELFICGQQCKADEFAERVCRGAWQNQKLKRITRREYKMKIG